MAVNTPSSPVKKKTQRVNSWTMLIISSFLIIGGLFSTIGAWTSYYRDRPVQDHGVLVRAQLVKKGIAYESDGNSDYIFYYRFKLPDNQQIDGMHMVSRKLWESVDQGSMLNVRYASDNPKLNFPDGEGQTAVAIHVFVTVIGGLMAIFGALFFSANFKQPKA